MLWEELCFLHVWYLFILTSHRFFFVIFLFLVVLPLVETASATLILITYQADGSKWSVCWEHKHLSNSWHFQQNSSWFYQAWMSHGCPDNHMVVKEANFITIALYWKSLIALSLAVIQFLPLSWRVFLLSFHISAVFPSVLLISYAVWYWYKIICYSL